MDLIINGAIIKCDYINMDQYNFIVKNLNSSNNYDIIIAYSNIYINIKYFEMDYNEDVKEKLSKFIIN